MEATVRILNQSGLMTRQYLDKKTGDQKVINSVTLKLTDGLNTFLGMILSICTKCSAPWWCVSGTLSRLARPCRPRQSMWIRLT